MFFKNICRLFLTHKKVMGVFEGAPYNRHPGVSYEQKRKIRIKRLN